MGRLKELDSLRGLACLSVLLFHYTTRYSEIFDSSLTNKLFDFKYGGLGVDLFFIISGFVIFLTIKKNTKPIEFLYKRFSRLYPTFWICVILTFIIIRASDIVMYHRSFVELAVNLTMIPDVFGIKRVDGVYWSLLPELAFYFLMFCLLLFKKVKHMILICFIWLIAIIANSFYDFMPLRVLFNLNFGHLFIIGISFYKIKSGEDTRWSHLLILCSFLVSLLLSNSLYKDVFLLAFIGVFYLFVYDKLKWIKLKPLIFLGQISYALYLTHQFIGYFIIYELINLGVENNLLLILIPSLITIILSSVITFYIEKPAQSFLRNAWNKRYSS
ncbi:acyltransferase family protein [Psychroserpens sp. MEBiC05023]